MRKRCSKRHLRFRGRCPPENPHRAKVHYFYALVQEADGNYDTAIEHLQHAAVQFPRDTRVRNKLGRMHFLKRNYETALAEFQKTLTVDPEDLDAHYNMMRCYRALKNPSLARPITKTLSTLQGGRVCRCNHRYPPPCRSGCQSRTSTDS